MPSPQGRIDQQHFSSTFGVQPPARVFISDLNKPLTPTLSKSGQELQKKVIELRQHMADVGVRPATMISIRPMMIGSQGLQSSQYPIPPCPIGDPNVPYLKVVIPWYETEACTDDHGTWQVKAVTAIRIAEDIKRQLNSVEPGRRGLIIYMGDRDPDKYEVDPYNPDKRNLPEELVAEKEAMIREFQHYFERAEGWYGDTSRDARRHIGDTERTAAHYLYHEKRIKELPSWVTAKRELRDIGVTCVCGSEVPREALKCQKCGDWVDPFRAYKMSRLSLRDDGALTALGRLTKEQLTELGLYPHIRPNKEMNEEMIKQMLKDQIAAMESDKNEAKPKK